MLLLKNKKKKIIKGKNVYSIPICYELTIQPINLMHYYYSCDVSYSLIMSAYFYICIAWVIHLYCNDRNFIFVL